MHSTAALYVHSHSLPLSRPPAALLCNHIHTATTYYLWIQLDVLTAFPVDRGTLCSHLVAVPSVLCSLSALLPTYLSRRLCVVHSVLLLTVHGVRSIPGLLTQSHASLCTHSHPRTHPYAYPRHLLVSYCARHTIPHRHKMSSHPHHVPALSFAVSVCLAFTYIHTFNT